MAAHVAMQVDVLTRSFGVCVCVCVEEVGEGEGALGSLLQGTRPSGGFMESVGVRRQHSPSPYPRQHFFGWGTAPGRCQGPGMLT